MVIGRTRRAALGLATAGLALAVLAPREAFAQG
jgi:hypothetical protein